MTEADDQAGALEQDLFGLRVNYQDDEEKLRAAEFLVAGRAERESLARTVAAAQDAAVANAGEDAVFDEVARAHNEAAAKLELLASQCRHSEDKIDLLGRAGLERDMATTAIRRSEEVRRLP
jgi:hypothetical protein